MKNQLLKSSFNGPNGFNVIQWFQRFHNGKCEYATSGKGELKETMDIPNNYLIDPNNNYLLMVLWMFAVSHLDAKEEKHKGGKGSVL